MKRKECSEGYRAACNLIDSEYDVLVGMSADDLWDYLCANGDKTKTLTREESDELYSCSF